MEHLIKDMIQVGTLTGDVVWPAIILFFCIVFRKQIAKGIGSLTNNNPTPQSKEATGKTANDAENKQTQPESQELDSELMKLVEIYSNLNLENRVESIRAKDAVARDMADLVIRKKISRDLLAEEHNECIVLALASTVRTQPEPEDTERLLRVADSANSHHVKYRVALAFGMLLARKLVSPSRITPITQVMTQYMEDADAALEHRLNHTLKMLNLYGQNLDS